MTHRADDPFLWQYGPLSLLLVSNGCESAFLIPLTFGNHTLGALLLAHISSILFSEESCQLLQHIADRIAIVVGNTDAWRSMTDLQESLQQENHQPSGQFLSNLGTGDIIYQSQAMEDPLQQADIVAKSDSTVLICGETGTGKEVIARTIHQLSPRRDKPPVKVSRAVTPASLLESGLFGHDKEAFTGAIDTHRDRSEVTDDGTLFLDEIGDLPPELQPKLPCVLQEREIERLGGSRTIPVNVRVIAATNRDLWQMARNHQFRSDLFYHLSVSPLELPPLRDRPESVPLLTRHFTQKMARYMNRAIDAIPTEILRQLMSWGQSGSVRELENVIERAVLLTRGNNPNLYLNVRQSCLLPMLNEDSAPHSSMAQLLHPTTLENDEEECQRIVQVLRETNGIVAGPRGAATRLGMKRATPLSRMRRLGISVREMSQSVFAGVYMRNKLSFDLQLSAGKATIAERIAAHKIACSKVSVFLMAMSAGVFMVIGFTLYLSVIADVPSSQALTHLAGGLCFTLGFILLAVCDTSLFTSSVMTAMAKSRGVISWRAWLINALLVVCGNLVGIACFSLLIWFSGLVMSEDAMWGIAILHCAEGKMHHTSTKPVSLGIMCNLMACLALQMNYCGCSLCSKIVAMILPIIPFAASGFEHCTANLPMIPLAIVIRHFAPPPSWQLAHSGANNFPVLTVSHLITVNLLPVILGNIIGDTMLVSMYYRVVYLRQKP